MLNILSKVFGGGKHERDLKDLYPIVDEINEHFAQYASLTDDELREKTAAFKKRIADETREIEEEIVGITRELETDTGQANRDALHDRQKILREELKDTIEDVLDEILPEAFAVVKETCRRLVDHEYLVVDNKTVWNMVPFDVQLIGGITLHEGKILNCRRLKERRWSRRFLSTSTHCRGRVSISSPSTITSQSVTANGCRPSMSFTG